jgi:hypothetical protein
MGEQKRRATIEGKGGLGATPNANDSEAAKLLSGALREQRRAVAADDEPRLTWLEEAAIVSPCRSVEVMVGDHKVVVANPKMGAWIAALPNLQRVLDAAKGSMGDDVAPLYVLLTLSQSWDAGKIAAAAGESVCAILDVFLGKEAGWTAENAEPQEVVALVAAFIQVIPVAQYRHFFVRAAGAWKGHQAAPTAAAP